MNLGLSSIRARGSAVSRFGFSKAERVPKAGIGPQEVGRGRF